VLEANRRGRHNGNCGSLRRRFSTANHTGKTLEEFFPSPILLASLRFTKLNMANFSAGAKNCCRAGICLPPPWERRDFFPVDPKKGAWRVTRPLRLANPSPVSPCNDSRRKSIGRPFASGCLFWGGSQKSPFFAPQKSQKSPRLGGYLLCCSHRPQMFPSGSIIAAKAPTPGTGVLGRATLPPSSVAFSRAASTLGTST
jgi:hypothetical protein